MVVTKRASANRKHEDAEDDQNLDVSVRGFEHDQASTERGPPAEVEEQHGTSTNPPNFVNHRLMFWGAHLHILLSRMVALNPAVKQNAKARLHSAQYATDHRPPAWMISLMGKMMAKIRRGSR